VMDEPTANLSPEATEDLAKLCLTLKSHGVTLVIVDHRLYWLRGVLDTLLVLKDGKVVFRGSLDLLAADPHFDEWGLRKIDVKRPDLPDVNDAYGRAVAMRPQHAAVSIRNLTFRYSKKTKWLYRDFSTEIPCGSITAVVGANGAGKTTLARLICGLLKPTSGEIVFHDGRAVAPRPPSDGTECRPYQSPRQRRERTAFVMQQMDIQLYMHTVEEELLFSAPRRVSKAERKTDAAHWLDVFGLSHLKNRHPHSLSGGEKQRLVVACAMMKRPSLMILDEPTSGLDGRNMRIIARELKEYASRGGAVLLITHDLELLELAADFRLEISRAEPQQEEVD